MVIDIDQEKEYLRCRHSCIIVSRVGTHDFAQSRIGAVRRHATTGQSCRMDEENVLTAWWCEKRERAGSRSSNKELLRC